MPRIGPPVYCSRCKANLPPGRRHAYCQACASAYARERRQAGIGKARAVAKYRERKYGCTPTEYARILDLQGGVCAICLKPETATRRGVVKTLAVDHDHESGEVRGLLCQNCNTAVGLMADDHERLSAAAGYVELRSAGIRMIRRREGW